MGWKAVEIKNMVYPLKWVAQGSQVFVALGRLERMVVFLYSDWDSRVLLATVHITRELLHSRIPGQRGEKLRPLERLRWTSSRGAS